MRKNITFAFGLFPESFDVLDEHSRTNHFADRDLVKYIISGSAESFWIEPKALTLGEN